MNVEGYNLDSLRKLVRDLQEENKNLRELLKQKNIPCESEHAFQEEGRHPEKLDPDQGGRIQQVFITDKMVQWFYSMFWGRTDVYAKRGKKGGYFPQCENRWESVCPRQRGEKIFCDDCKYQQWKKLDLWKIKNHLLGTRTDGTDVIGIYPLFPNGTCRFLVFDFDNHEKHAEESDFANTDDDWKDEVDALRLICRRNEIDALTERSRSGRGAHVWIFFKQPVSSKLARTFGSMLLEKGTISINLKNFQYYDRMYPSQDAASKIGNLIALPLQGDALKNGNSAFVDMDWNAYPDQWRKLLSTRKLTDEQLRAFIVKWNKELTGQDILAGMVGQKERPRPWKRKNHFQKEDVIGVLHIILGAGIYIDALNLAPRMQNQIRCMATLDNPVYYQNKRSGRSNYYHFSTIYLGKDIDGYIQVPRGLLEQIIAECQEAGISYDISNQRATGFPIRVKFHGELRMQQELAAQIILQKDDGILSAATAFGKTVVCAYLIAKRKVNTLILLESKDLVQQWIDELNRFLEIDEEPPEYQTKTGKKKRYKSVIGTLQGGIDKTTGIIDIAMMGSVYKKGKLFDHLQRYGMVFMDECHHAASAQAQQVLSHVNSRYLYGVSATPMRSDHLQKINYMLLGPIRHRYTSKDRIEDQGMECIVVPRFTRTVNLNPEKTSISDLYDIISSDSARNQMILQDVKNCVKQGRTPVILTRIKKHVKYLYNQLQDVPARIFLYYGDNTDFENNKFKQEMREVSDTESVILVATGQKIGEGFDFPRLDTLMLTAPVAYGGRLEQYVGRLSRPYLNKKDMLVYDYVDLHIPVFERQYNKRLATYKKIGFRVWKDQTNTKQETKAIFDSDNYTSVFEQDLIEAKKQIIIASPELRRKKVERFLMLVKSIQEKGVKVFVITENPEQALMDDSNVLENLISVMKNSGIRVCFTENEGQHYAIIDQTLVWYGGMNLLGKADAWDNLIRVNDTQAAAELLEISGKEMEQA